VFGVVLNPSLFSPSTIAAGVFAPDCITIFDKCVGMNGTTVYKSEPDCFDHLALMDRRHSPQVTWFSDVAILIQRGTAR
jgi:hypothetical protein